MKTRHSPLYSLAFALVAWAEASISLLALGQWCPSWTMSFSRWYALRSIRAKGKA